jgi:SAM-dependent methyltransferase
MAVRPPPIFDEARVRQRLARAIAAPDFPGFLHEHAAREILSRLELSQQSLAIALAHASRPDLLLHRRMDTIRAATVLSAHADLVAAADSVPVKAASLDCLLLLFGPETVNDIAGLFAGIRRSLRPDGLFLGATLAGETLRELRDAWSLAEAEVTGGATPRVAPFAGLRDLGDLMLRAGLALPVVDSDRLVVRYADPLALMRELKRLGWSNALVERTRQGLSRRLLARVIEVYFERFADADGRIRATFEIAYLTGFAPHPDQPRPLRPGSAKVRLADALGRDPQGRDPPRMKP